MCLFVQVTQLEQQLDREKKSCEHFKGAFKKVTSLKDELSAKNASLEDHLRVSPKTAYLISIATANSQLHVLTSSDCQTVSVQVLEENKVQGKLMCRNHQKVCRSLAKRVMLHNFFTQENLSFPTVKRVTNHTI